jgi:predicted DNA-binding transcriptional regulator AlpA
MQSPDSAPTVEATEEQKQPRFVSKKELLARVGVTYPTIWKWMRQGAFPRARKISETKCGWLESEVNEWMLARPPRSYKPWDR